MSGHAALEQVFDDSLALSSTAADSRTWGFLDGLRHCDRVPERLARWISYSVVIIGGERYVATCEPFIPAGIQTGEKYDLDFPALVGQLCAAYPSRRLALRRAKTWRQRYDHRLRSVGVLVVPAGPFNAARFVEEMYRTRAQLMAELEARAA
jgi:hypothetical protein